MTTNDQRARKLSSKVEAVPTGFSSAGAALTLVETFYEEIIRVAGKCLEMRDDGLDTTHRLDYIRQVGTLDGLVWGYCFAWDNSYEPHFTEACTRVRRQAIREARKRITEESA